MKFFEKFLHHQMFSQGIRPGKETAASEQDVSQELAGYLGDIHEKIGLPYVAEARELEAKLVKGEEVELEVLKTLSHSWKKAIEEFELNLVANMSQALSRSELAVTKIETELEHVYREYTDLAEALAVYERLPHAIEQLNNSLTNVEARFEGMTDRIKAMNRRLDEEGDRFALDTIEKLWESAQVRGESLDEFFEVLGRSQNKAFTAEQLKAAKIILRARASGHFPQA